MTGDMSIVVRRDTTEDFGLAQSLTDGSFMVKPPNTNNTDNELHCEQGDLLGPLGLLVQGLLAFIAFSALIVKRFCEPIHERRSWKIWFFDTSKQGFGAAIIHFANVFLAGVFSGDPCTWYFISFMLDSSVGLVIIYIGLKISQIIAIKKGWDILLLGEYGKPPSALAWLGQCLIYIIVMIIEKLLVTLLVLFNFWKKVREFILSPIKNPSLELVIVMFIVPFIVNAFIFWVVDNFLKKKAFKLSSPSSATSSSNNGPHGESAMKYFSAVETVKYYDRNDRADDSESDVLLSMDDDVSDSQLLTSGGSASNSRNSRYQNDRLERLDSNSSQYHLLGAEIT